MPIIKSAKKRVRVAKKATTRNVKTKRSLKAALKNFQSALSGGNKLNEAHAKAQSALGKAAKKNVIHKNKLARKQRQLSAKAKAAGLKPAAAKKATSAKKATVKKSVPAKKTTTKKKS
ncbi:MAG TPA: 30S ribosomal protein S20 [Patescibacteria group bacterium]|nr:30S ribosomal protein S20 [Patescibacteria group bacterium]